MAYKKIEITVRIVVDDTNEELMEQLEEMKAEILAGTAQKELFQADGISDVKMTFKEIK